MNRDEIIFADLIRDGGSAKIAAILSGQKVSVRVMRSIGERKGELFGKYEVTRNGEITIVDTLDRIAGLEAMIQDLHHDLNEHVVRIFFDPKS